MNNDVLPGFDDETCDSLAIELQKVQGVDQCVALRMRGQIDTYSSLYFQRSAKKAIDAGFNQLLLVLSEVGYVSSMGVGALIQVQKAAMEKGGEVSLVDLHPKIMEILKLLCLEKYFSCTESVDEAVAPVLSQEKALVFPKIFPCTVCEKKLQLVKPGRFRCPECKTILVVAKSGSVSVG
jgi:anti-anti-sigma factor